MTNPPATRAKVQTLRALDATTVPEVDSLCAAINALPGLTATVMLNGPETPVTIWFRVDEKDNRGLFVLARSVDRRYWEYGYMWSIIIDISDAPVSPLPISYRLSSESVDRGDHHTVIGEDAYAQAEDLAANIRYHLGHPNFLSGFGLPADALELWGT